MLPNLLTLSPHEFQVFYANGLGISNPEVAKRLGKSVKTVEAQCSTIREKLGLANIWDMRSLATRFIVYSEANGLVRESIPAPQLAPYAWKKGVAVRPDVMAPIIPKKCIEKTPVKRAAPGSQTGAVCRA